MSLAASATAKSALVIVARVPAAAEAESIAPTTCTMATAPVTAAAVAHSEKKYSNSGNSHDDRDSFVMTGVS